MPSNVRVARHPPRIGGRRHDHFPHADLSLPIRISQSRLLPVYRQTDHQRTASANGLKEVASSKWLELQRLMRLWRWAVSCRWGAMRRRRRKVADDGKYCWPGLGNGSATERSHAPIDACQTDTIIIELHRMGLWPVLVPGMADADQKNGN
jgi:hypothetical protein